MSAGREPALLARLPFVVMRRSTFERMRRSVTRYRALRGHMRVTGDVKASMPREAAEKAAERMTERHGKSFEAYPCRLCNGMYHVGHRRIDR